MVQFLIYFKLVAAVRAIMSTTSPEDEGATGGLEPKTENLGDVGGHPVKTEMVANKLPSEDAGALLKERIAAMTEAFPLPSDKPSLNEVIGGRLALKEPKPYSLGQDFKVWLSQFDDIRN